MLGRLFLMLGSRLGGALSWGSTTPGASHGLVEPLDKGEPGESVRVGFSRRWGTLQLLESFSISNSWLLSIVKD
jgi:hypothetical protein